jgi:N utilization substance protein A
MNLIESFSEFKTGKNIDRPTLVRVLEDVFRTLIKKKYGADDNFEVIVNTTNGDLELWQVRSVVPDGEVTEELTQISYSEAQLIDQDYDVNDECYEKIDVEAFGRRAIMAARQTLVSRITELEKEDIFKQYNNRVGELVLGEIGQIMRKDLLIIDDATGNELLLPRAELIKGDFFRKGDMIKAVIKSVEMRNNLPVIIVSRTDNRFLQKLLEQEVPEIEDGLIVIKNIVRIPGIRAKVSVESYDDRIDPVGACVGMKGSRIHGIVRELRNENIDIINYTSNTALFIQRSLTPAKVSKIEIDEEHKKVAIYLKPDQVSLAIGKNGANIKLATELTGLELDIYREIDEASADDVDLDEFRDEVEDWVIDQLKSIGCDTAKSVLSLNREELIRRTDLEEETIDEILNILQSEFEDNQ